MILFILSILILVLGITVWFLIFDTIFVKIFKTNETTAVWFSFILLVFIMIISGSLTRNIIPLLIVPRLIISIIVLFIFLYLAEKDEKEKKRIMDLPEDAEINIEELANISNMSVRKIKYYIYKKLLEAKEVDDDLVFEKSKALEKLENLKIQKAK